MNFNEYVQDVDKDFFDESYWQQQIKDAVEKVATHVGTALFEARSREIHARCLASATAVDHAYGGGSAGDIRKAIDSFLEVHRELLRNKGEKS